MAIADTVRFLDPLRDIRQRFRTRFRRWVDRRIPPGHQLRLGHRSIFILPTRQGLGFLLVLGLMLVGAINYEASLAFGLVFLLLGLFLLSILHTFRNLAGLQLTGRSGEPVFAGEPAQVEIVLNREDAREHQNIVLGFSEGPSRPVDLVDSLEARVRLSVPTRHRGWLDPGRLTIETRFPLGLCRAWSLVDMSVRVLVYPTPIASDLDWLLSNHHREGQFQRRAGEDDFHGLRDYQPGDPLRHVAWKQVARGLGMYTKQYVSTMDEQVWLDWEMFAGQPVEERLSRLAWCITELDARHVDYGLRLPGLDITPGRGSRHRGELLAQLALFGSDAEEGG